MAHRWFSGLDFYEKVPHFSTFGKNYKRRFEGTDLFEQLFRHILLQCMKCKVSNADRIAHGKKPLAKKPAEEDNITADAEKGILQKT